MPRYRVRKSCEYATDIEAPNPEEALAIADEMPTSDWESAAWSCEEVIELDEEGREAE